MAWRLNQLLDALAAAAPCATVDDLVAATCVPRRQVVKSMGALWHRGLAEPVDGNGCYRLTAAGEEARTAGRRLRSGPVRPHTGRRRPVHGTMRERVWRALRIKVKATLPELVELAARGSERDAYGNARKYLRALEKAGYVRRLPARARGAAPTSPGHVKWVLLRNTGPAPPAWHPVRGEVEDLNTGEITRPGLQSAEADFRSAKAGGAGR